MTATDELRRLLDERGVKWMPSVWSAKDETFYKVGEIGYLATELSSGRMKVCIEGYPTPEQAIAATLGTGTCHMRLAYEEEDADGCIWPDHYECDACGANVNGIMPYYDTEVPPHFCPNCGRRNEVGE